MTINEAIARVREMKADSVTDETLIYWLSVIDGKVAKEIHRTDFNPYKADTDRQTELLVPFPYTDIYIRYLEAMIDEKNQEIDSFTNDMVLFNNEYENYAAEYCRTHHSPDYKIKFTL